MIYDVWQNDSDARSGYTPTVRRPWWSWILPWLWRGVVRDTVVKQWDMYFAPARDLPEVWESQSQFRDLYIVTNPHAMTLRGLRPEASRKITTAYRSSSDICVVYDNTSHYIRPNTWVAFDMEKIPDRGPYNLITSFTLSDNAGHPVSFTLSDNAGHPVIRERA